MPGCSTACCCMGWLTSACTRMDTLQWTQLLPAPLSELLLHLSRLLGDATHRVNSITGQLKHAQMQHQDSIPGWAACLPIQVNIYFGW